MTNDKGTGTNFETRTIYGRINSKCTKTWYLRTTVTPPYPARCPTDLGSKVILLKNLSICLRTCRGKELIVKLNKI